MIAIPFYVFLLIYLGFLLICGIFLLINLSHLFHTGTITLLSLTMSVGVAAAIFFVLLITLNVFPTINWNEPILFGSSGSGIITNF